MGIFFLIGIFFFNGASNTIEKETIINNPKETGIKVIVFDLGDVLFTTSKSTYAKTIIPIALYNPTLLYLLTQVNPKEFYFEFLDTITAESQDPVYNKGKKLPLILADWMSGVKTSDEIRLIIQQKLTECEHPIAVKNLFSAIGNLMFTPEQMAESQEIIVPMAKLVQDFKNAGYQVCVLSNFDEHSFEIIQSKHQNLFNLFDKILISGKEKTSKPNPEFYKKLLHSELEASECLFIDDEPYNIQTAQKLGFKTILHSNYEDTAKELIQQNILKTCKK